MEMNYTVNEFDATKLSGTDGLAATTTNSTVFGNESSTFSFSAASPPPRKPRASRTPLPTSASTCDTDDSAPRSGAVSVQQHTPQLVSKAAAHSSAPPSSAVADGNDGKGAQCPPLSNREQPTNTTSNSSSDGEDDELFAVPSAVATAAVDGVAASTHSANGGVNDTHTVNGAQEHDDDDDDDVERRKGLDHARGNSDNSSCPSTTNPSFAATRLQLTDTQYRRLRHRQGGEGADEDGDDSGEALDATSTSMTTAATRSVTAVTDDASPSARTPLTEDMHGVLGARMRQHMRWMREDVPQPPFFAEDWVDAEDNEAAVAEDSDDDDIDHGPYSAAAALATGADHDRCAHRNGRRATAAVRDDNEEGNDDTISLQATVLFGNTFLASESASVSPEVTGAAAAGTTVTGAVGALSHPTELRGRGVFASAEGMDSATTSPTPQRVTVGPLALEPALSTPLAHGKMDGEGSASRPPPPSSSQAEQTCIDAGEGVAAGSHAVEREADLSTPPKRREQMQSEVERREMSDSAASRCAPSTTAETAVPSQNTPHSDHVVSSQASSMNIVTAPAPSTVPTVGESQTSTNSTLAPTLCPSSHHSSTASPPPPPQPQQQQQRPPPPQATEYVFIDNHDGTAYLADASIQLDGSYVLGQTILLAQSARLTQAASPSSVAAHRSESRALASVSPVAVAPGSDMLPHQARLQAYLADEAEAAEAAQRVQTNAGSSSHRYSIARVVASAPSLDASMQQSGMAQRSPAPARDDGGEGSLCMSMSTASGTPHRFGPAMGLFDQTILLDYSVNREGGCARVVRNANAAGERWLSSSTFSSPSMPMAATGQRTSASPVPLPPCESASPSPVPCAPRTRRAAANAREETASDSAAATKAGQEDTITVAGKGGEAVATVGEEEAEEDAFNMSSASTLLILPATSLRSVMTTEELTSLGWAPVQLLGVPDFIRRASDGEARTGQSHGYSPLPRQPQEANDSSSAEADNRDAPVRREHSPSRMSDSARSATTALSASTLASINRRLSMSMSLSRPSAQIPPRRGGLLLPPSTPLIFGDSLSAANRDWSETHAASSASPVPTAPSETSSEPVREHSPSRAAMSAVSESACDGAAYGGASITQQQLHMQFSAMTEMSFHRPSTSNTATATTNWIDTSMSLPLTASVGDSVRVSAVPPTTTTLPQPVSAVSSGSAQPLSHTSQVSHTSASSALQTAAPSHPVSRTQAGGAAPVVRSQVVAHHFQMQQQRRHHGPLTGQLPNGSASSNSISSTASANGGSSGGLGNSFRKTYCRHAATTATGSSSTSSAASTPSAGALSAAAGGMSCAGLPVTRGSLGGGGGGNRAGLNRWPTATAAPPQNVGAAGGGVTSPTAPVWGPSLGPSSGAAAAGGLPVMSAGQQPPRSQHADPWAATALPAGEPPEEVMEEDEGDEMPTSFASSMNWESVSLGQFAVKTEPITATVATTTPPPPTSTTAASAAPQQAHAVPAATKTSETAQSHAVQPPQAQPDAATRLIQLLEERKRAAMAAAAAAAAAATTAGAAGDANGGGGQGGAAGRTRALPAMLLRRTTDAAPDTSVFVPWAPLTVTPDGSLNLARDGVTGAAAVPTQEAAGTADTVARPRPSVVPAKVNAPFEAGIASNEKKEECTVPTATRTVPKSTTDSDDSDSDALPEKTEEEPTLVTVRRTSASAWEPLGSTLNGDGAGDAVVTATTDAARATELAAAHVPLTASQFAKKELEAFMAESAVTTECSLNASSSLVGSNMTRALRNRVRGGGGGIGRDSAKKDHTSAMLHHKQQQQQQALSNHHNTVMSLSTAASGGGGVSVVLPGSCLSDSLARSNAPSRWSASVCTERAWGPLAEAENSALAYTTLCSATVCGEDANDAPPPAPPQAEEAEQDKENMPQRWKPSWTSQVASKTTTSTVARPSTMNPSLSQLRAHESGQSTDLGTNSV